MPAGFTAVTPVGAIIACSEERWAAVVSKHPVLAGRGDAVRDAIADPLEIRRSRHDPGVWLCYRRDNERLLCAVIRPDVSALVTAYPADAMKQGDVIWKP